MSTAVAPRPVILVAAEDTSKRSRPKVFFRVVLALPHLVWFVLWLVAALLLGVVNWLVVLITARSPGWIHEFLAAFIRYGTHVSAYLNLATDVYPGFTGTRGGYPIDVEIAGPERQNRWTVLFRGVLIVPAALVSSTLAGGGFGASTASFTYGFSVSLLFVAALCAWWVGVIRARMPSGLQHAIVFCLSYSAQLSAYALVLTDRYPSADPALAPAPPPSPSLDGHPVVLRAHGDGAHSRPAVFFRFLLAIPQLLWLYAWTALAQIFVLAQWFVVVFTGRADKDIHVLLAAYLRYQTVVFGWLWLLCDPYPPFLPKRDEIYAVDLEPIAFERERSRGRTFWRLVLAVPALLIGSAYSFALIVVAFLSWWAIVFTGRMPSGLRRLGLAALRYQMHLYAWLYLVTDRYPYSGPVLMGIEEPRRVVSGPSSS